MPFDNQPINAKKLTHPIDELPGIEDSYYSDATPEDVKQDVKSLNNIGAPTSITPMPGK